MEGRRIDKIRFLSLTLLFTLVTLYWRPIIGTAYELVCYLLGLSPRPLGPSYLYLWMALLCLPLIQIYESIRLGRKIAKKSVYFCAGIFPICQIILLLNGMAL